MNLVIYEHKNCELPRLASEHQNTVLTVKSNFCITDCWIYVYK